jgi:uncharacterized protein (DUF305 family)
MIVTPVLPRVNICGRENATEMLTAVVGPAETRLVLSAPRSFLVGALTASALFATTACGDDSPAPAPATAATAATVPAAAAPSGFGGTDLAWVEVSIAINEQLLPLLDLAPANGASPAVRKLAAAAKTFTTAELVTLRELHDQAKLPSQNPHEGMPMPGMVTPEQVTQAAGTKGAGFDSLLLTHLRESFEQGVNLATSETRAGIEPQTVALAREVLKTRGEYLPQVKSLAS